MSLRRVLWTSLGALLAALCLAGAAQAASESASTADAYADPSRALGATSPSCRERLDAQARRNCRATGSAIHPHPLSAYGIDVRVGFSITDPGKSFLSALQSLVAGMWMGLLYLIKGALLLLEWAFSLDLTGRAMPQAHATLARLHERAFGDPWLLLGISIAGIWGIWRGLVQRRTSETVVGLAATVALMVGGLVIIRQPEETVGRAASLINDAGMEVLSASSGSGVNDPRDALVSSLAGVFDTTVRGPWCALEFGSTDYCDRRTGDARFPTNAELWLAYPAQSWQRDRLHKEVSGGTGGGFDPIGAAKGLLGLGDNRRLPDDVARLAHKSPEHVRMQEAGGTFPRIALLGVIAIGLLGAVALYAYLALRLLLAGALTLLFLLLAPAMLIAPAFGDSGRATFLAWVRRLVGALAAKLIYAVFLAVVLAASQVFAGLGVGWFGTWLLLGAFWWGVFLKRHEIVDFVSAGVPRDKGASSGHTLAQGYYGWQLARAARASGARVMTRPAHGLARGVAWQAGDRQARAAAAASVARESMEQQARTVLVAEHGQARGIVNRRDDLARDLRALDVRLQGYDTAAAVARARGGDVPDPSPDQRVLLSRRAQLRAAVSSPAAREALEMSRHAERNRARTGTPVSEQDVAAYRARRLADIRDGLPLDHERSLRAAGIDPNDYSAADPERRDAFLAQARAQQERDRELLALTDGSPRSARSVRVLDAGRLREETAAERRRMREERRRRRARDGVFRPR